MIAIEKLRYVRLGVADLKKTADFATRIVGLQPVDGPEETAMFRSDYRDHTLVLYPSDVPEQTVAIELRSEETMKTATCQLRAAGYEVTSGDAELCQTRRAKAVQSFRIRGGVTIELVVRPLHLGGDTFRRVMRGLLSSSASPSLQPMSRLMSACGPRFSAGK